MPPSTLARRKALFQATILDNPYIPEHPTPRQAEALLLDCDEVFYGGAAGGGKSSWLLMGALQYAQVPGYAALILRRSYADLSLPGAIMDRAYDWLAGTDAHWSDVDKTWTFPGGGTLTFGYLQTEKDRYRYRSAEFQFIGWDELTDFPLHWFQYLHSRTRRIEGSWVPIRVWGASNPDGPGAEWVKERFVTGQPVPGERYAQTVTDETTGQVTHRAFVPAKLDDNPHVDGVAYRASLANLDPVTREQLLNGNWDVRHTGGMFSPREWEIVDDYPRDAERARYWDTAATSPTSSNPDPDWTRGVLLADAGGVFYIIDVVGCRSDPGAVESTIASTAALDGYETAIGMEQEPGSSGKAMVAHYARGVLKGYRFRPLRSTGSKVERAKPLAAAGANGNLRIVRGAWNSELLRELEVFPQTGFHDDIVDAASGAHYMLTRRRSWTAA